MSKLLDEVVGETTVNVRKRFRVPDDESMLEPEKNPDVRIEKKEEPKEPKKAPAKPRQKKGMTLSSVAMVGGQAHMLEMVCEFALPGYPLERGEKLAIVKLTPIGKGVS